MQPSFDRAVDFFNRQTLKRLISCLCLGFEEGPIGTSTRDLAVACRSPAAVRHRRRLVACAGAFAIVAVVVSRDFAKADQGGLSFWLPGLFGSLTALPGQPGWTWTTIYYHTSVSAEGGQTFQLSGFRGGSIVAGLQGQGNLAFFGPTYVFATPILGGQVSLSLLGLGGRNEAAVAATLTGPKGNSISGAASQGLTSVGDLVPQASIKWNAGVNNFMVYATGDIPVGDYDPARLANLGAGHGAIDGGGAYTYFDPQSGNEFSAALGATYNFENVRAQYRNGVDLHLDAGASHFVTKELQLGVVGYALQQVSCDGGANNRLGCFKSRVFGVGPQIGFIIPMGEAQGYINLKGYKEFAAENRPQGWNLWLTFAVSPAPPAPQPAVTK